MKKVKPTGRAMSIPAGLALGGALSLGSTLLLSAAVAWMILAGLLPAEAAGYGAVVILLISGSLGAYGAVSKIKRLAAQVGLAAGAVYYILLLAMSAVFFGGRYQGMGVTALVVFAASALVILLSAGGKNRAGCRRRKKRW